MEETHESARTLSGIGDFCRWKHAVKAACLKGYIMIYLPIEKLEEGMVLARSIPSGQTFTSFVAAGITLNERLISRIRRIGVQGAYVEWANTDDIEPSDFVDPELKVKLLGNIKEMLDGNKNKNGFRAAKTIAVGITPVVDSVVLNVLNQDKVMFQMIDIRDYDNYTYYHSLYVGTLSALVGRYLGYSEDILRKLSQCGLLHDIGKADVPIQITNKPGKLTAEEFEEMKKHPVQSAERLKREHFFSEKIIQGVRYHHECFDGSGYPDGLAGYDIPLYARILTISDVYDALSAARPYRKAWPPRKIMDYMTSRAGAAFDPELLAAFMQCVAAYPVGVVVTLSDGSTAVVKDNTPGFALRPIVQFLTPDSRAGQTVDLSCECNVI